ncbi:MAG TPA: peroxiredoxin [Candidatus Acidoferrum sp.]|nr:peroxiredoxin [Candidatus Acidoferrum sp.]
MKIFGILIVVITLFIAVVAVRAVHTGEKAPRSGTPAPDFTLNSQDGKPFSLRDLRGKWVVLYFYPKDFTSGCTIEARNFQRDLAQYEQKNAIILGVSVQEEHTHQAFCAKEGLHFKLLADTNYKVSSAYDSLMSLGVTRISARHTFLIDPDGLVRKTYLNVEAPAHSAQVLADLAQFQQAPAAN